MIARLAVLFGINSTSDARNSTRRSRVLFVANRAITYTNASFFNDAYQTISDIQFIATDRVAPVMGYKYNIRLITRISV